MAQHAADRYTAENDILREMYKRATNRRLEMRQLTRRQSQEPLGDITDLRDEKTKDQFLTTPSIFNPVGAALALPNQVSIIT